jgi:LmbE family N-acetylglucosaminyl deacetylase
MKLYQHIYLSPHYDDISLSCGGAIHQQTQSGQPVLGVTICAAPPPHEHFSDFAAAMHQQWGDPGDVVAARQAEDQASMKILGVDEYRLTLLDCIYRGKPAAGVWYYNSDSDLFGDIHPDDLSLTDQIAQAVAKLTPDPNSPLIYAPLTVGHHVDHQLAHTAAWKLYDQGYRLVFYEDYPYVDPNYPFTRHGAGNKYDLAAALATPRPAKLKPELRYLSEENLQAKIDSIQAYATQLNILFGGAAAMERYVREYALHVGAGRLAERVWLPISPG